MKKKRASRPKKGEQERRHVARERLQAQADLATALVARQPKVGFSASLFSIVQGNWLGSPITREERRFLVPLLLGVYVHKRMKLPVNQAAACEFMGTNAISTGPKYLKLAVDLNLVLVEEDLDSSRRQLSIRPTPIAEAILSRTINDLILLSTMNLGSGRDGVG